jgi:hypothetical protein
MLFGLLPPALLHFVVAAKEEESRRRASAKSFQCSPQFFVIPKIIRALVVLEI